MVSVCGFSRPAGEISKSRFAKTYFTIFLLQGITIFLLFDLKRKIYYMAYEMVMGRPHPSVRRHRLLKAALPGVAGLSLGATSCSSSVQKSVKSQVSREADSIAEASNATSTGEESNIEEDQRFVA